MPRRAAGAAGGAGRRRGRRSGPGQSQHRDAGQLDTLDGIGPTTAQKILDWRKQHGGFGSVDDLKQISGIGSKRFDALTDKLACTGSP